MLILGHRGTIEATVAQNSLRACQQAITSANGFETDACASKDGDIFLIHEAKYADAAKGVEYAMAEHLDPASAALLGNRRMEQLSADEVRHLRLQDGQPLPTLREAVELVGSHRGKLLNIELKARDVVGPVLKLVQSSLHSGIIKPEALLLSSFNHFALDIVRREAPDLKRGAIFIGPDQPTAKLFPWHPEDPATYTALTPEALRAPILEQIQPDYFVMPEDILNEATAAMIEARYPKAKLIAWVFTEKGSFDVQDLLARLKRLEPTNKVAAMIVDNPGAFRKVWQQR